jgi:hypothetical protein
LRREVPVSTARRRTASPCAGREPEEVVKTCFPGVLPAEQRTVGERRHGLERSLQLSPGPLLEHAAEPIRPLPEERDGRPAQLEQKDALVRALLADRRTVCASVHPSSSGCERLEGSAAKENRSIWSSIEREKRPGLGLHTCGRPVIDWLFRGSPLWGRWQPSDHTPVSPSLDCHALPPANSQMVSAPTPSPFNRRTTL